MDGKEKRRMAPVQRVGAAAVVAVFMFTLLFTLLGNTAGIEAAAETGTAEQVELLSKGNLGQENSEEEFVLEPVQEDLVSSEENEEAGEEEETVVSFFEADEPEAERSSFERESYLAVGDEVEEEADYEAAVETATVQAAAANAPSWSSWIAGFVFRDTKGNLIPYGSTDTPKNYRPNTAIHWSGHPGRELATHNGAGGHLWMATQNVQTSFYFFRVEQPGAQYWKFVYTADLPAWAGGEKDTFYLNHAEKYGTGVVREIYDAAYWYYGYTDSDWNSRVPRSMSEIQVTPDNNIITIVLGDDAGAVKPNPDPDPNRKKYSITYKNPDGLGTKEHVEWVYGGQHTLSSPFALGMQGPIGTTKYRGWTTKEGSMEAEFVNGNPITVWKDYTFYLVYQLDTPPPPSEYTITYKANGGTGVDYVVKVAAGDSHTVLHASDAKQSPPNGYTYRGWSTSADPNRTDYVCGNQINNIQQDYVLYMTYYTTPQSDYQIIYLPMEGKGNSIIDTVKAGASITLRGAEIGYTRDGYVLAGWKSVPGNTDVEYNFGQTITPTSNMFMCAVWEKSPPPAPDQYTITYKANGGTGADYVVTVNAGDTHTVLSASAAGMAPPNGKVFSGWSKTTSPSAAAYQEGDVLSNIQQDHTLYMAYYVPNSAKYTITYFAWGGNGTTVKQEVRAGDFVNLYGPDDVNFTRDGYVLTGWTTMVGTGESYSFKQTIRPVGDMILFAVWGDSTPVLPDGYTITYKANGGSGEDYVVQVAAGGQHLVMSAYAVGMSPPAGQSFWGWSTIPDPNVFHFGSGYVITNIQKDYTLYMSYFNTPANTYVISYYAMDGTGAQARQVVNKGESVTLYTQEDVGFTLAGSVLTGWSTMGAKPTYYSLGQTITPTSNMTLQAVWGTGCTISYNANGGEGSIDVQVVPVGMPVSLSKGDEFSRYRYDLVGWNTMPDGSGTGYSLGQTITPTQNMTLYAVWEPWNT